jgi:uncharacterized protein (TIGR04255 family)
MVEKNSIKHTREREILSKPPIVEALIELRWVPKKIKDSNLFDSDFKFLPVNLYNNIKTQFPFIEVLGNTQIPDEINPNLPKYRFRAKKDSYPLIQIASGVLTINFDKGNFLSQDKFLNTSITLIDKILSDFDFIKPNFIKIHYIDVFSYTEDNMCDFIEDKFKTSIKIKPSVFEKTKVPKKPSLLRFETKYDVENPKGQFHFVIRSGKRANQDVLLMDTVFYSQGNEIPQKDQYHDWFEKADDLIHEWFYEIIRDFKEIW